MRLEQARERERTKRVHVCTLFAHSLQGGEWAEMRSEQARAGKEGKGRGREEREKRGVEEFTEKRGETRKRAMERNVEEGREDGGKVVDIRI